MISYRAICEGLWEGSCCISTSKPLYPYKNTTVYYTLSICYLQALATGFPRRTQPASGTFVSMQTKSSIGASNARRWLHFTVAQIHKNVYIQTMHGSQSYERQNASLLTNIERAMSELKSPRSKGNSFPVLHAGQLVAYNARGQGHTLRQRPTWYNAVSRSFHF